jgi:hypothetical protein
MIEAGLGIMLISELAAGVFTRGRDVLCCAEQERIVVANIRRRLIHTLCGLPSNFE